MRALPIAALAASLAAGAALAPPAGAGSIQKVEIGQGYFAPAKKVVKRGAKVRFVWPEYGFDVHDVRVRKGPEKFRSPLQATGTWTRTFRKAGTFRLYCSQHSEMTMTLVVKKG